MDEKTRAEFDYELNHHPAFADKFPSDGGEVSQAFEALQALKYDDDDAPEERAEMFKLDGNKQFGWKQYNFAIAAYTDGIKARCADRNLNAILYANRAACHFRLGNFRSAYIDCRYAVAFDPHHFKAQLRGAECLEKLKDFVGLVSWCEKAEAVGLENVEVVNKLLSLKEASMPRAKEQTRNLRKKQILERKSDEMERKLFGALSSAKVRFYPDELEYVSQLKHILPSGEYGVHISDKNDLIWPVLLLYPEFDQSDLIQEFNENSNFEIHLAEIIGEASLPWDSGRLYSDLMDLDLFFTIMPSQNNELCQFSMNMKLKEILSDSRCKLRQALPTFYLLSRKSQFYDEFRSKFTISQF